MKPFGHPDPEERLYSALGDVFALDTLNALCIALDVNGLVAAFVADSAATRNASVSIDFALERIAEMRVELDDLARDLEDYHTHVGSAQTI